MKKYSYKGQIVTADSKEEAIKVIAEKDDFESYKKEFEKYWGPKYDEFYKVVKSLKYVSASMWLTNCEADFDSFASFSFGNGFAVKECPITYDYWIKDATKGDEESIRKIHFGDVVLKDEAVDELFWRWERDNNYKKALENIKRLEEACKKYF